MNTKYYAPVMPVALHRSYRFTNTHLKYSLLLAHDVQANLKEYQALFYHRRGKSGYTTILDNSVIELGAAMNFGVCLNLAEAINANYVVMPDVIGDMDATQTLINREIAKTTTTSVLPAYVIQGKDMNEIKEFLLWLKDITTPRDLICVPRWIANKMGSRMLAVRCVQKAMPDNPIHLLGMSSDFEDDIACTREEGVLGIDSANPMVIGHASGVMADYNVVPHMNRGDYMASTKHNEFQTANIKYVQDRLNV